MKVSVSLNVMKPENFEWSDKKKKFYKQFVAIVS